MILPIIPYGNDLLRKKSIDIDKNYNNLNQLISSMFKTMINAYGVGISAIQVGININLFIINYDIATKKTEDLHLNNKKKVFINATIIEEKGKNSSHKEGCLSIPTIFENVIRKDTILVKYLDENFKEHVEELNGLLARVIQHEYDHTIGKLFIDYLPSDIVQEINKKLELIKSGKLQGPYPMKY